MEGSAAAAVGGPQNTAECCRNIRNMLHDIDSGRSSIDSSAGNGSLDETREARYHQRQDADFPVPSEITPDTVEEELTMSAVTLNLSSPYFTPHASLQSSLRRSNLDSSLVGSVTSFLSASGSFDLRDSLSRNADSLLNESLVLSESHSDEDAELKSKTSAGEFSPSPLRRRHQSSFDPNCCWRGRDSLERSDLWGSSHDVRSNSVGSKDSNGIALLRGSKFSDDSGATKESDETIEHSNSIFVASASSTFLAPTSIASVGIMSSGSYSLEASLNEMNAARRDVCKSLDAIAENSSNLPVGRLDLGRRTGRRRGNVVHRAEGH